MRRTSSRRHDNLSCDPRISRPNILKERTSGRERRDPSIQGSGNSSGDCPQITTDRPLTSSHPLNNQNLAHTLRIRRREDARGDLRGHEKFGVSFFIEMWELRRASNQLTSEWRRNALHPSQLLETTCLSDMRSKVLSP